MQGYNNLSPNNGNGNYGYGWQRSSVNNGMMRNGMMNSVNANMGYGNYQNDGMYQSRPQQQIVDERIYVTGRAGADAYPMPQGVNMLILWDNDADRFYIKGYDNNGRPRVLADNDFQPHVEPEPIQPNIDLSNYPTKDDIQHMISEAFNNITLPNMSSYVTQKELNAALSNLAVGNGGRIVRNDEPDA